MVIPVSPNMLDPVPPSGLGVAPGKDADPVTPFQKPLHHDFADVTCAADDQDVHDAFPLTRFYGEIR